MNVGMLWLDDDKKRPFAEKVKRAAEYYQTKYGRFPNTCFVNKDVIREEKMISGVLVAPVRTVLPHHFWVGVKNEAKRASIPQIGKPMRCRRVSGRRYRRGNGRFTR